MRLFPSVTLRSFVRQVCRPRNDSPPLPLGEGWGEGLAPLDKGGVRRTGGLSTKPPGDDGNNQPQEHVAHNHLDYYRNLRLPVQWRNIPEPQRGKRHY